MTGVWIGNGTRKHLLTATGNTRPPVHDGFYGGGDQWPHCPALPDPLHFPVGLQQPGTLHMFGCFLDQCFTVHASLQAL